MLRALTIALALAAAAAVPAQAQTVVDGSARGISQAELGHIFKLTAERISNASAAQYRNIKRADTTSTIYCGEVSAGDTGGRFVPFAANLSGGVLWVALPGQSPQIREQHKLRLVGFGCARR
jgi:hypothetical protein